MFTLRRLLMLWVLALLPTWTLTALADESAEKAFKQMSSLLGEWEGKFADGRLHHVSYRLTAADTVLVETWRLAPGRESITLYHRDGNTLIADHYCPQGNVPRLELFATDAEKLSFKFRDGTNLQAKGKSHQHAFWIQFRGKDSFVRSETYVDNGSTAFEIAEAKPGGAITYTRIHSAQEMR